jgi:hypothetical protein
MRKPKRPLSYYYDEGIIEDLVLYAMVSPLKLNYPVYVNCVNEYMDRGMKKTEAVQTTSINCKVCENTVWNAISTFKKIKEADQAQ